MLSISRPDNGARRLVGSSLKFIVDSVFVNGKMAVSSAANTKRVGDNLDCRMKIKRSTEAFGLSQSPIARGNEPR